MAFTTSQNLMRTALVGALVVFGMIVGLLVETTIARRLAASEPVQIYRLAFSLPLLLALTVTGALVNTAVAELSRSRAVGEEAYRAAIRFIGLCFFVGSLAILGLGVATLSIQQRILAPGLADAAVTQFKTTAAFGWVMFFVISLTMTIRAQINLAGVVWLNPSVSLQRNLGFLVVLVLFYGAVDAEMILPLAALAASAVVLVVHLACATVHGAVIGLDRFRDARLDAGRSASIAKALVIAMVFQILSTSTTLADRSALSVWDVALVPHFDYSVTVITAFGALFANVTSIIILPMLLTRSPTDSAREDRIRLYLVLFLGAALCVSLALALGRVQIVALLFERGAFLASDTSATSDFLLWHAIGLFFLILNSVYFVIALARSQVMRLLPIAVLRWVVRLALLAWLPDHLPPATRIGLAFAITEGTIFGIFQGLRMFGDRTSRPGGPS